MTEHEEHGMMRWFGPRAWSAACQSATEIPVPVGATCSHCEEAFVDGDEGVSVPDIGAGMRWVFFHQTCLFRFVVGSVGHQMGTCSCAGQQDTSEIGMTKREAAVAAADYWLEQNNRVRSKTPRTIH